MPLEGSNFAKLAAHLRKSAGDPRVKKALHAIHRITDDEIAEIRAMSRAGAMGTIRSTADIVTGGAEGMEDMVSFMIEDFQNLYQTTLATYMTLCEDACELIDMIEANGPSPIALSEDESTSIRGRKGLIETEVINYIEDFIAVVNTLRAGEREYASKVQFVDMTLKRFGSDLLVGNREDRAQFDVLGALYESQRKLPEHLDSIDLEGLADSITSYRVAGEIAGVEVERHEWLMRSLQVGYQVALATFEMALQAESDYDNLQQGAITVEQGRYIPFSAITGSYQPKPITARDGTAANILYGHRRAAVKLMEKCMNLETRFGNKIHSDSTKTAQVGGEIPLTTAKDIAQAHIDLLGKLIADPTKHRSDLVGDGYITRKIGAVYSR